MKPGDADDFAQGLLALEQNWRGPLLTNRSVETTLQQFRDLERRATPAVLAELAVSAGALPRLLRRLRPRSRLIYETDLEEQALAQLRMARELGSLTGDGAGRGDPGTGDSRTRSPPICARGSSSWPRRSFRAFACN